MLSIFGKSLLGYRQKKKPYVALWITNASKMLCKPQAPSCNQRLILDQLQSVQRSCSGLLTLGHIDLATSCKDDMRKAHQCDFAFSYHLCLFALVSLKA